MVKSGGLNLFSFIAYIIGTSVVRGLTRPVRDRISYASYNNKKKNFFNKIFFFLQQIFFFFFLTTKNSFSYNKKKIHTPPTKKKKSGETKVRAHHFTVL